VWARRLLDNMKERGRQLLRTRTRDKQEP
jgi:hypothetical protein